MESRNVPIPPGPLISVREGQLVTDLVSEIETVSLSRLWLFDGSVVMVGCYSEYFYQISIYC